MVYLLSDVLMNSERARPAAPLRAFASVEQIRDAIRLSKNYRVDGSAPETARPLLFFQTSLQQTWLVRTDERLYCILDDVRRPQPHINWSIPMSEVVDQTGKLLIRIEARDGPGSNSGLVDIGSNHRDWLYSRKLFAATGVEKAFEDFLRG